MHEQYSCQMSVVLGLALTVPLVQIKQQKRYMRFGSWNVRGLYRSGSLMTVARELARYKLYLVGVQEVRWDK